MTREQRCQLAIERGINYDPKTGKIYGVRGNEIKTKSTKGYIIIQLMINYKKYMLKGHQFAWYWVNKECVEEIDHINGIKYDNRIYNLINSTHQKNMWNVTKAKGYYRHKASNKWLAQITINKKSIYLGIFKTEEEARQAYLDAKEKYHK